MDQSLNHNPQLQLREKLVLETIQSKLTVKDSVQYIIEYCHSSGNPNFTLSQSSYEKLKKSVKEKIKSGKLSLENTIPSSNDSDKISELINIYTKKIKKETSKPDIDEDGPSGVNNHSQWDDIHAATNVLIKLFQVKHKIRE